MIGFLRIRWGYLRFTDFPVIFNDKIENDVRIDRIAERRQKCLFFVLQTNFIAQNQFQIFLIENERVTGLINGLQIALKITRIMSGLWLQPSASKMTFCSAAMLVNLNALHRWSHSVESLLSLMAVQ